MKIVGVTGLGGLWALGQSIGIDDNNTFQLKFLFSIKTVGATVLAGLWA